jgi:hypothetical protein
MNNSSRHLKKDQISIQKIENGQMGWCMLHRTGIARPSEFWMDCTSGNNVNAASLPLAFFERRVDLSMYSFRSTMKEQREYEIVLVDNAHNSL